MDATQLRDKLIGTEEERAVSPVIGVILMVAITVILAAVIAAFVMDLGNMSESANAGISFDESGDDVTVQVINEGNTDLIWVEVHDSSDNTVFVDSDGNDDDTEDHPWTVGDSVTLDSGSIGDADYTSGTLTGGENIDRITVYGEVGGDRQVVANWEP